MEGSFDFFLGGGWGWKIWSLQESPPENEANVFFQKRAVHDMEPVEHETFCDAGHFF